MSLNAPLKILRLARVPFLLLRANVTSITVVGIILHHSTLILINSRRKALKFLAALRTNFLRDVSLTVLVLHVVDKILPFLSRKNGNVVQTVVMFLGLVAQKCRPVEVVVAIRCITWAYYSQATLSYTTCALCASLQCGLLLRCVSVQIETHLCILR